MAMNRNDGRVAQELGSCDTAYVFMDRQLNG